MAIAVLCIGACTEDTVLEPGGFGTTYGDAETTVHGTVYVGGEPFRGVEARLYVYRDQSAEHNYWRDADPYILIDQDAGAYVFRDVSANLCPALSSGMFVMVAYRVASGDTWFESDVQPWAVNQNQPCGGATFEADIVIPLP